MKPRAISCRPSVCAALAAGLLVSACGTMGHGGEARANVFPADYKTEILAVARTYVNNPHRIKDAGIAEPVLKPVGHGRRYMVCVRFNAMDTDNKYTGTRARVATFRRGRLDQFSEAVPRLEGPKSSALFEDAPSNLCADAVYQPFPELEKL